MAKIKSADRIKNKWKRVTSGATAEYTDGINNPREDWATATKDAESSYESGVTAAIGRKQFGKGVDAAGTSKWQEMARAKGPQRFSQGVALAEAAYAKGFAPYREVIAGLTLPPRGAKGDPANLERVRAVAEALHARKIAGV